VDSRKKIELEWDLGTGQALAMGEEPGKIKSTRSKNRDPLRSNSFSIDVDALMSTPKLLINKDLEMIFNCIAVK
jgi:hypothetical protein